MSGKKNQVAAIQMASSPHVSANLLEAERLIGEASESGAGLVVLPENFAFKGEHDRDMLTLCEEPEDGPLQGFLSQMAKRYGVWLVGGTIPLRASQGGKVRAACLVMDDQGRRVARYDKIHLFDVHLVETDERYVESSTIESGNQPVVLDTPFGKLGIAVCYDLRFPELFRRLLEQGAELFAVPSSFTAMTGKAHWKTLVRARAIENLAFVIAAAQGGYHISGRETHGHSMIVDPWGTVLSQVPRGTGYVSVELDTDYQKTIRRTFPTIDHRQLY
ncbi:MAG: carbon-nitrogen hydrolase family protein [Candidatus Thiodiazotropha lotti]|uniref:Acyltransferase n=1 Tax=Candidatus Thiodiazotropha endoloripes TaxID=1818881 RepID=A0A1E2UM72_9GAMM|nr:carbon-nitrogen hydrolase family protein [Candidatus Thiodiazotropha endoloripes]MCG7900645.1 carbon-nitrogen hydrolase family protein [Candidatus Thiodiazotropha weberae]MCG7991860.1 carbon-nitrogen hydrolase family protein [Candidatus Thiodiazotropha lotti]MCG7901899.1 carbon-nitrogen hydrolase family protein [Candidatus Thiodiazotropha weberae]MCG7913008.1 carbon-nitrogen hydrolase family protein [Candidatus Thiodiazotropha weberae]MCG8000411.1 carbon-nitrogen hydrolase family protein [C